MKFLILKTQAEFDEVHARIMKHLGLPHANAIDWAKPRKHPKKKLLCIPVNDSCIAALTDTEKAQLQDLTPDWHSPIHLPKSKRWWKFWE